MCLKHGLASSLACADHVRDLQCASNVCGVSGVDFKEQKGASMKVLYNEARGIGTRDRHVPEQHEAQPKVRLVMAGEGSVLAWLRRTKVAIEHRL